MQSIFVFSYGLPTEAVNVKDGIITIQKNMLGNYNPAEILEKTKTATSKLKRIKGYNLLEQIENSSPNTSNKKRLEAFVFTTKYDDIVMPNHSLFQPLITDPKWPRFTVAYQYYLKDGYLKHAFAPNFGASFPVYRIVNEEKDREWEVGIQAGLFGLMDIGRNPTALINADYYVGIPVTYSANTWSSLTRFYHMSSHFR